MRILLIVSMLFTLSASGFALSVEEAISLSLENNESIKQERELLEAQSYTRRASYGLFLPALSLSYSGANVEIFDDVATYDGLKMDTSSLDATLGLNVFNGFSDFYTVRMARSGHDVQALQYNAKKQDVILDVKNSYVAFLQAKNAVEIAQETLELLEIQHNTATVAYNVGQLSRADVLQVDVQLASSRVEFLNAKKNLRLAKQQLEKLIGRQIADDEEVVDFMLGEYRVPSLSELNNYIDTNRSEMLMVKMAEEVADMKRKQKYSNFMPAVNVFAGYSWYGDNFNPFNGRTGTGADFYDSDRKIGVSATWTIPISLTNFDLYRAEARNAMAAAHSVNDTRSNLRLALSAAYESYESAKELLSVADAGVQYAEENYRVMKAQFDNSQATTTDLLNASIALNRARTSLASAKYGIISAVAALERAVELDFMGIAYNDADM